MSYTDWMQALEDTVADTCSTERFEAKEEYPPGERRWMVVTHNTSKARAMVWFQLMEKVREAPVGVTGEVLEHLEAGNDVVVAVDDTIRMRANPSR